MQLLQFFFSKINTEEILRKILRLETSEACQDTDIDIPTNIIKENADVFADIFFASFIDSVKKSNFPFFLKNANITSVYKKGGRNSKDNYRPLRILPNMSKIFERCIFSSIIQFYA